MEGGGAFVMDGTLFQLIRYIFEQSQEIDRLRAELAQRDAIKQEQKNGAANQEMVGPKHRS